MIIQIQRQRLIIQLHLCFKFTDKKAVRMLTLTSSKSGREHRIGHRCMAIMKMITGFYWETTADSSGLFFNVWGKYTRPFIISADKVGKYSRYKVVLTGTD